MTPPQPLCPICQQPLGDLPGKVWHFECEVCQICNAPMHHATKVIQKCIDDGGPIAHLGCYHKQTIDDLKANRIPLTQKIINDINVDILSMKHIVEPDITDYQSLAGFLKDALELASTITFVLDLTREKIKIVDRIETTQWEKAKKKEKLADSAKQAESDQERIERSARLAKERENPWLRNRRKAIEQFVKGMGLSLEAATALVDEGSKKQGLDPQTGSKVQ